MKPYVCRSCNGSFEHPAGTGYARKYCPACAERIKREKKSHSIKRWWQESGRARTLCRDCGVPLNKDPSSNTKICDACRGRIKREDWQRRAARISAERRAAAPERMAQKIKDKPWLDPSLSPREKRRLRCSYDPGLRIRRQVRRQEQKRKIGQAIRRALKGTNVRLKLKEQFGYTPAELRTHIERQFTPGMTWEKFAAGEIHIDHIVPLVCFDLSKEEDIRAAWAITNLRPLWAADNMKKNGKRLHLL